MGLMDKLRDLLNRPSHAPETAGPGAADTPSGAPGAGRHERGADQSTGTGHEDDLRAPRGERA